MKKSLFLFVCMMMFCMQTFAGSMNLNMRAGGELSTRDFSMINGAVTLDVLFEKFPWNEVNQLLNFGKFSFKPYVGVTLLPTTYFPKTIADNKLQYAIFGDVHVGLESDYEISAANKITVGADCSVVGYGGYSINIGSKFEKINAGLKLNNIFSSYYSSFGLFGNYSFNTSF